jgi:tRNA (guanine37-N1)-methyltransferase
MRFDVVTIFPGMFAQVFEQGVVGRALERGLLELQAHDLREHTHDRHRQVDDMPFGGGPGMVMKPEPIVRAVEALDPGVSRVLLLSPGGRPLTQALARALARESRLVLICGRYGGVDERVVEGLGVEEVSIGDYVLPGGESAALVMIEAIVRLLPDVLGNPASHQEDSHSNGLLEGPSYTRPPSWRELDVPEVLLSGDHTKIAAWRHEQGLQRTRDRRPDLLD